MTWLAECCAYNCTALFQIPKEIGQLRSLTCLDVSHNKDIKHLPEAMGSLEHLFVVRHVETMFYVL